MKELRKNHPWGLWYVQIIELLAILDAIMGEHEHPTDSMQLEKNKIWAELWREKERKEKKSNGTLEVVNET